MTEALITLAAGVALLVLLGLRRRARRAGRDNDADSDITSRVFDPRYQNRDAR